MPMHKRILCLVLTAVMLLSLIPAFALPSQAASNMKTSEAAIKILKDLEGFSEFAYYDYSHYSIGYGSSCEKDEYPNGITEEEADALLREFLGKMEEDVNRFANRQGILFSQNQFDALMLFTYNVGSGWVLSDGEFRQAVIENASGNDFLYAICLWSTAGNELSVGLLNRRLLEADIYLNCDYANGRPSNYTYVIYNNNGGEGQARAQGFDCNLEAFVKSQPELEGKVFLGWYTAKEGGAWVTELTAANAEQTLYAHWQEPGAAPSAAASVSYQVPAADLVTLEIYDAPGGSKIGSLNQSAVAMVQADYVDANGVKWGRLVTGRWVKLGNPRIGTLEEAAEEAGVKVTVTGDYVNVRTGPGTNYPIVSGVVQGNVLNVTRVVSVNGVLWGLFRGGWLCLDYTDYSGGLPVEAPGDIPQVPDVPGTPAPPSNPTEPTEPSVPENPGTVIATGVVTATQLNIRAAAGTNSGTLGCYNRGDKVEILQTTTVAGAPWGRTNRGWICLTYVKLDEKQEEPETTVPTEPETTEPEATEPSVPETTVPPETKPEQMPDSPAGIPGTVTSKAGLLIRSGPGSQYQRVGAYSAGQQIRILEQVTANGMAWGRTDKGWVSMQYVKLSEEWALEGGVYGVIISLSGLNIRFGPGVGYGPVDAYPAGARVLIFQQKSVAGQKWGRTDKGWISMDYVRLESVAEQKPEQTEPEATEPSVPETTVPDVTEPEDTVTGIAGTVTATGLNIRQTPGNGTVVGTYRRGDRIIILEKKLLYSTYWGRTDRGWISLSYVKLDSSDDNAQSGRTGIITAGVLCIRSGPGTGNAVVGTYTGGQTVIILETTRVGVTLWGRTDKGWICMDYVK